jgi:hypothetical protein
VDALLVSIIGQWGISLKVVGQVRFSVILLGMKLIFPKFIN